MRQLVLPPVRVKRASMDSAFDAVFGPAMLRRVHGPSTRVGDFKDGKRAFKFRVDVSDVPPPIRRFFCGKELGITTTQKLTMTDTRWDVTNRLKLHFVGAELFSLKPAFYLEATDGGIFLGGAVRHSAVLPPPLNGVAEAFMMANSERELRHFGACLAEAGVIDPPTNTVT